MNKNKKGFTLLETIVAISVLVTAIIGPFNLASQTIKAQNVARNNLIAANFAQEGIELFRNYRANNVLLNENDLTHWLDGTSTCSDPSGCAIDVNQYIEVGELPACTADLCKLYLNQNTKLYEHCGGSSDCTKTPFRRSIHIDTIDDNPEEIEVTVLVTWEDQFGSQSFSASTHLLNW